MKRHEARELLDSVEDRDATALEAHMDWKDVAEALETIANMHHEYAVEVRSVLGDYWVRVTRWEPDPQLLFPKGKALVDGARIVRRLATDPEVVE